MIALMRLPKFWRKSFQKLSRANENLLFGHNQKRMKKSKPRRKKKSNVEPAKKKERKKEKKKNHRLQKKKGKKKKIRNENRPNRRYHFQTL